jgi:SH3-like domain-containing protein
VAFKEPITVRSSPAQAAHTVANLEKGVIMRIKRCNDTWCQVENPQFKGWILKSSVWGVFAAEYLEN